MSESLLDDEGFLFVGRTYSANGPITVIPTNELGPEWLDPDCETLNLVNFSFPFETVVDGPLTFTTVGKKLVTLTYITPRDRATRRPSRLRKFAVILLNGKTYIFSIDAHELANALDRSPLVAPTSIMIMDI